MTQFIVIIATISLLLANIVVAQLPIPLPPLPALPALPAIPGLPALPALPATPACPAGFGAVLALCVPCPAGKTSLLAGLCVSCPVGYYTVGGAAACFPCPAGTVSAPAGESCIAGLVGKVKAKGGKL